MAAKPQDVARVTAKDLVRRIYILPQAINSGGRQGRLRAVQLIRKSRITASFASLQDIARAVSTGHVGGCEAGATAHCRGPGSVQRQPVRNPGRGQFGYQGDERGPCAPVPHRGPETRILTPVRWCRCDSGSARRAFKPSSRTVFSDRTEAVGECLSMVLPRAVAPPTRNRSYRERTSGSRRILQVPQLPAVTLPGYLPER